MGCNFNCLGSMIINNIFLDGRATAHPLRRRPFGPPPPNGELFARNIVVWKEGPLIKEKDCRPSPPSGTRTCTTAPTGSPSYS